MSPRINPPPVNNNSTLMSFQANNYSTSPVKSVFNTNEQGGTNILQTLNAVENAFKYPRSSMVLDPANNF